VHRQRTPQVTRADGNDHLVCPEEDPVADGTSRRGDGRRQRRRVASHVEGERIADRWCWGAHAPDHGPIPHRSRHDQRAVRLGEERVGRQRRPHAPVTPIR
ncbi:MAG: hypothetical protein ACK55I_20560, partial [bacterium]